MVTCLIGGVIIGASFRGCSKPQPTEPIVLHDTLTIRDTLRIAGKTKTVYVSLTDTMIVRDTDTIRIEIPIEHKEYRDTFETDSSRIELGVHYQGYKAKIDSIDLKSRYTIQPSVVEKKRGFAWCVMPSVQVGYGVAFGSPVVAAPYVGIGVSVGWGYTWRK